MHGKSIFLICLLLAFYLLIAPVNAQNKTIPQEMGLISVKELYTSYSPEFLFDMARRTGIKNVDEIYIPDHIIVSGFIRDLEFENPFYRFRIDDGTGVIDFWYNGGLGDIKEGDKVFVEINPSSEPINYYADKKAIPGTIVQMGGGKLYTVLVSTVSKNPIPTNIKSEATTPTKPETASVPKTPGFEIVIGAVAMFFAWKKLLKRR